MSQAASCPPPPPPPVAFSESRRNGRVVGAAEREAFFERGLRLENGLLDASSSRELLDAALTYLMEEFNAAAFFLVQGPVIVGREARGDPALARLIFPTDSPTVFGRVATTRQPLFGEIPEGLRDDAIHRRARRCLPAEVLCVPLVMDGICVGLVYADRLDAAPAMDPTLPFRLGNMVGTAFFDLFARDIEGVRATHRDDESASGPLEDADGVGATVQALASTPNATRAQIQAVVDLGSRAREALIAAFPGQVDLVAFEIDSHFDTVAGHGPLLAALVQMGRTGIEVALAALSDSNALRRRYGALLLADLPSEEAIIPLITLLGDPEEKVSRAAQQALASLRSVELQRRAVEGICRRLEAQETHPTRNRSGLIAAAGDLGHPSLIDPLLPFLDHPKLQGAADDALGRIAFVRPRGGQRARVWREHLGQRAWYRRPKARARFALEALEREDEAQAFDALSWLTRQSGHDFGYRLDGSSREKRAALHRWRSALSL